MASAAQIAANRANAQRSSGPRTETGRRASSLNAVTHGLTAHIMRQPEQDEAWRAYHSAMFPCLLPDPSVVTAFERDLADRIIHDCWRLQRAAAIDENLLTLRVLENEGPGRATAPDVRALAEARAFRSEAPSLNLLSLYQQRLERSVHKNLALLKSLQKERTQQPAQPPATSFQQNAAALKAAQQQHAAGASSTPQPVDSPAPPPEIGFVYSATSADSAPPPRRTQNALTSMAA